MLVHETFVIFMSVVIFSCWHSHVLLITLQVIDLPKYYSQDRHKPVRAVDSFVYAMTSWNMTSRNLCVICFGKKTNITFAHYKCSLGEHSPGCRLTFTRQECDCGNAWYRITDNQNQSRLDCRTCLPNRKSQTGGYHKEDNKIDFRVFLGLNISLKSIRKDFVIFNTENSFLHPSF